MYSLPGLLGLNNLGIYTRYSDRKVNEIDSKYIFLVDVMQITPGVRIDITESVILKAEYSLNLERGVISQINNDVFTSSLVVKF